MFDELLKIPGVQNAQGALLWFLAIASVVLGLGNHLGTILKDRRAAKDARDAKEEGNSQARTNQFESISAAEARFREATLGELERLRERFANLETRYEALKEQYETLEGQYDDLKRQYDTLIRKADATQDTLSRIESNQNG